MNRGLNLGHGLATGIGSMRRITTTTTKFSAKPWMNSNAIDLNHQLIQKISTKEHSQSLSTQSTKSTYIASPIGLEETHDYRIQFMDIHKKQISPWHDIPLIASVDKDIDSNSSTDSKSISNNNINTNYNFICEIPANTKLKMEISTTEVYNPIKQDINKIGTLRSYHGPIYWNYGCLPQTWEDPTHFHPECECYGDNDPVDVVEVGSTPLASGSVTPIKILGGLALKDQGELDWKLIGIRSNDPLVRSNKAMGGDIDRITDLESLERHYPHVISGIREWFRWYKVPDNKPLNEYAYNGDVIGRDKAIEVVYETHEQWKQLIKSKSDSDSSKSNDLWTHSK